MPRTKLITPEELVALAEKYMIDQRVDTIKIPALGRYIRESGHPEIADYTLRRCPELKEYIQRINEKSSEEALIKVATFSTLDVNVFLTNNNTLPKLRVALSERDAYYQRVAMAAGTLNTIYQKTTAENEDLKIKMESLEAEVQTAHHQIEQLKTALSDIKVLQSENKQLRSLISKYVYPEAANSLLHKEGLVSIDSSITDSDKLKEVVMTAETDIEMFTKGTCEQEPSSKIQSIRNSVVADLLTDLDGASDIATISDNYGMVQQPIGEGDLPF